MWRLGLYGSISGSNGEGTDWILLFAPLALLIGSAAVLSRIFPAIYRMLSNLASLGRGLTAALAFWQTSRDPTHVTRLVLLFALAMALGVLSTGLNATLKGCFVYSIFITSRDSPKSGLAVVTTRLLFPNSKKTGGRKSLWSMAAARTKPQKLQKILAQRYSEHRLQKQPK